MAKYTLLEKQQEFFNIPHNNSLDVVIYQGGYGSGKTWCGSLLGIMLARKYPGCRGLVCAKEYVLVRDTTLESYFSHLEAMGYVAGKHYTFNKIEKKMTFANGSEILFKGVDNPEKIKSLNLHWAEIEEASQVSDSAFKQLIGRLRNTNIKPSWGNFRYRLFGHTNPQANKGWIYKRFVENKKDNYRLIIAPTSNNIYLPEHYLESMKEDFDPEYYRINVLGQFGNYSSGLVVKNFTDDNIKHLQYNENLPLHLTCDFNVDPMCWCLAHKDDKNIYFFDELVIENTTTQQAIDEFIRRYPNHKGDLVINGDASGDNRTAQSEFTMVIGGNITTNINETYNGNKVMAAYGLQDKMYDYFEQQTWDAYDVGMSLYKRSGWMSPLMYLIASCGIATVLGVGTYLINSGQMTAGSFASFVTSLLLLYKPVKTLGNTLTGIQGIFVAMGRVFELFDLEPEIKDTPNARVLVGLNNSIKFENVNFEYIPNQPVLKNLNLTVAKNETLAIVGNSGGGKSTLVNLIPRFYDIKSGSIKFDDVDIREYTIDSLRQNISMVFQDNFLYSGTIRENIMMGNFNATENDLQQAIFSAHLQDMIKELPQGLDTMLGERGLTLSGGQRQRVAIARAMLRNAPIVILDEATSALDNESEAIVQKAMDNLMKDRTVFIIAHRLSTIKNADRIAVINEGELVELGTHEELMNVENGQYKALYEMQFKKQEVM